MNISSVSFCIPRTFFQSLLVPAKVISILFLRILGHLLHFFGAKGYADHLKQKAHLLDCECGALVTGIFAYGRRFLIKSINHLETCRGSCYWFIERYLRSPHTSLEELAKAFEDGPPKEAIMMHRNAQMPVNFSETRLWSKDIVGVWPPMPKLRSGVYTFLIGYSRDELHPERAHIVVFFNQNKSPMLFDPSIGLSEWKESDWEPLLQRIANELRSSRDGYFTIQCCFYQLRT